MQQKPKVRRRMTKRFFIVTFCALLLYVGITFFIQQQELNRLKAEQKELQQQTEDAAVEKDKRCGATRDKLLEKLLGATR